MTDAFLIERARLVAGRLARARCWHSGAAAFGRGTSTKWFDLNPTDVEEAIIRLRELASGIEAPSGDETRSGSAEGESPTAESGDAL